MLRPQSLPPSQLGHLLILESDPGNRILFAEYLEQCGYKVSTLANGKNLYENLQQIAPDLLLLSLRLPEVDGFTVIQQLRSHPTWRHLAILVVSGYTLSSIKQKAYDLGADDYLTKPVLPVDLSNTVGKLLRRQKAKKQKVKKTLAIAAQL
jgi:two-component system, cell cycle response regulator DivK